MATGGSDVDLIDLTHSPDIDGHPFSFGLAAPRSDESFARALVQEDERHREVEEENDLAFAIRLQQQLNEEAGISSTHLGSLHHNLLHYRRPRVHAHPTASPVNVSSRSLSPSPPLIAASSRSSSVSRADDHDSISSASMASAPSSSSSSSSLASSSSSSSNTSSSSSSSSSLSSSSSPSLSSLSSAHSVDSVTHSDDSDDLSLDTLQQQIADDGEYARNLQRQLNQVDLAMMRVTHRAVRRGAARGSRTSRNRTSTSAASTSTNQGEASVPLNQMSAPASAANGGITAASSHQNMAGEAAFVGASNIDSNAFRLAIDTSGISIATGHLAAVLNDPNLGRLVGRHRQDVTFGMRGLVARRGRGRNHYRYRQGDSQADVDSALDQLEDVLNRDRGLNGNELNRLPTSKYQQPQVAASPSSTANDCQICLGSFERNEVLRTLPCLHRYHQNCIDPWLTRNAICPTCKLNIKEQLKD